ncbi:E3 SUMO-protein ligase RanBP2 [Taenia crassiceps]|uniref:Nuclear pore complex protein Nup153 n=1 Tax=Taenia crassiceps TaxID=6207 RepID=A0ABR4Q9V4_9CEST
MSDRGSHGLSHPQSGRSIRRRKSLLYRITDTITSFLPSLFESKEVTPLEDDISDTKYAESSAKRPRTVISEASIHPCSSRLPSQLSISRLEGVQIPTVPSSVPIDVDVDLDAADDKSEYSIGSRASVSTSGVSSLLPRSHRNEHATVKPSKECVSEYTRQGNSSNRNKGFVELWTDLEGSYQSAPNITHSAPKRMRTESTQSSSSFYHGKVAYGGASSVRCTSQSRNVFEHVAPLRYLMENNIDETPKSPPSSSNAILSATAQRILQSLERHGSAISSSNKISSPAPIPFSPLSTPLQRSTTRYPSYMATYNRYKEFKRRFAAQSTPVPPQFSIVSNRIEEHDNEDVTRCKDDNAAVTGESVFEASYGSSQASKSTSIQPHGVLATSENSQPAVISHSSVSAAPTKELETTDKVGSSVSSAVHDASISAKLPVETEASSSNEQTKFVFSDPIALGSPTRPSGTLSDASGFTFSYPKSRFKRPAPAENSSLPIFMSSRQRMVSDHSCPSKKVSVPFDLDLWRCESCLMENSGRDGVCKSCHLPASVPSFSKSDSSNTTSHKPAFLFNLPSNGWECPTCMVKNKIGVSECVCCRTLNPSSELTADASKEKVAAAPIFNFGPPKSVSSADSVCVVSTGDKTPLSGQAFNSGISVASSSPNLPKVVKPITSSSSIFSKGWSCPTCLVKNDDSLKDCPCCKTAKPESGDSSASGVVGCASNPGFNFSKPVDNNATPTTVTFCFGSNSDQTITTNFKFGDYAGQRDELGVKFAKMDKNKWECPTCMVKNGDDVAFCPCCQTKRPSSLKSTPGIPSENGEKWVCPTCSIKRPSKSNSVSVDGEWTCASCSAKNGALASKCVSCQNKKPEINRPVIFSPGTPVDGSLESQYASSPPVVMSSLKSSLNFGPHNLNASSGFNFPAVVVSTPSFSFSKPADASNTSAKGFEPPVTSMSSNLKNGGFNFGSPATTSGLDFSAKKENMTPVVNATAGNFSSVPFNFGPSTRIYTFYGTRSPRDRIKWTSDSPSSTKAEQGIADVCSAAIGTDIDVFCGAFLHNKCLTVHAAEYLNFTSGGLGNF